VNRGEYPLAFLVVLNVLVAAAEEKMATQCKALDYSLLSNDRDAYVVTAHLLSRKAAATL
jgi:hypothetical protein